MSLRAKIEAVVYAAEEPVTLAQLAAVFAPEVREIWLAEKSAAQDATRGAIEYATEHSPAGEMLPEAPEPAVPEAGHAETAPTEAGEAEAAEGNAAPIAEADAKT